MTKGYDCELSINPGETPAVRAHITNDALVDFTQASFGSPGSIRYDLINLASEAYVRENQTLTAASVVFDTLQAWPDDGSTPDADGYNFLHRPTGSDFASGVSYEARYTFTDTNSRVSVMRVKIDVLTTL